MDKDLALDELQLNDNFNNCDTFYCYSNDIVFDKLLYRIDIYVDRSDKNNKFNPNLLTIYLLIEAFDGISFANYKRVFNNKFLKFYNFNTEKERDECVRLANALSVKLPQFLEKNFSNKCISEKDMQLLAKKLGFDFVLR